MFKQQRKQLEAQRKAIEAEEKKYKQEMERVQKLMAAAEAESNEVAELRARLEELTQQMNSVSDEKEKIINLQNGKAGTVYIISNLGSFGDSVFKIGMTRRLEPQDRVNELGDPSAPFQCTMLAEQYDQSLSIDEPEEVQTEIDDIE